MYGVRFRVYGVVQVLALPPSPLERGSPPKADRGEVYIDQRNLMLRNNMLKTISN